MDSAVHLAALLYLFQAFSILWEVFSITSSALGGAIFNLLLADKDHSGPTNGRFPIDYGSIGRYESINFTIHPPFPENISGENLGGAISSLVVPGPGSIAMIGISILLATGRRRGKSRECLKASMR